MFRKNGKAVLATAIAALMASGTFADITGFDTNTQKQGAGFTPTVTGTGLSSVLTLTDNNGGEGTSAFNTVQQNIGNFVAAFTYAAGGNKSADGAAFVVHNDPRGAGAVGDGGGSLGYGGGGTIKPSFAAELNLYTGGGNPTGEFLVTNGATGTYNNTAPVNPGSGSPINATVSYNGAKYAFTLSDGTNTYTQTKFINLTNLLGSNTGYVGFTGGTGGAVASQTITNFQFTANAAAVPAFVSNWTVKRINLDTTNNTANAGGGTINNQIENTDEADNLAHGTGGFTAGSTSTEVVAGINYNNDFPGGRGDDFAAIATGVVHLPAGTVSKFLYVDSDDGFRLRINGAVVSEFVGLTGGSNTMTPTAITLHEGDSIELVMAERGGGEKMILQTDDDGLTSTAGDRHFVGDVDSLIQIVPAPEPGTIGLLGLAALPMLRRRRR